MTASHSILLALVSSGICLSSARAQEPLLVPDAGVSLHAEPATETASSEAAASGTELAEENARLREELEAVKEDLAFLESRLDAFAPLTGKLSGYLDVGLFYVSGDGSGLRPDFDHTYFPEYGDVTDSWVFMGDPLSTTVNSRGDPGTTGDSRAVTFDPIRAQGVPGFIVNNVNLSLFGGIGEHATVNASVDLLPRTRLVADADGLFVGDFLDVKLAWAEYRVPLEASKWTFYAGKFDSVLGVEYRTQEAPARLTVTPSLACRYTCGRPIGLKARGELLQGALVLNAALTNGSSLLETFGFHTETESNWFKTASARLSYRFPVGTGVELGASGAFGAQDAQPANDVYQWHFGFDLHGEVDNVVFAAEFVRGRAEGDTDGGAPHCGVAPCLDYRSAYGLAGYRVFHWFQPYARVDWRDAFHRSGESFVYVSDLLRVTAGARFQLHPLVVAKAEVVLNQELGRIPQFPNDVFVSSLVVRY